MTRTTVCPAAAWTGTTVGAAVAAGAPPGGFTAPPGGLTLAGAAAGLVGWAAAGLVGWAGADVGAGAEPPQAATAAAAADVTTAPSTARRVKRARNIPTFLQADAKNDPPAFPRWENARACEKWNRCARILPAAGSPGKRA